MQFSYCNQFLRQDYPPGVNNFGWQPKEISDDELKDNFDRVKLFDEVPINNEIFTNVRFADALYNNVVVSLYDIEQRLSYISNELLLEAPESLLKNKITPISKVEAGECILRIRAIYEELVVEIRKIDLVEKLYLCCEMDDEETIALANQSARLHDEICEINSKARTYLKIYSDTQTLIATPNLV